MFYGIRIVLELLWNNQPALAGKTAEIFVLEIAVHLMYHLHVLTRLVALWYAQKIRVAASLLGIAFVQARLCRFALLVQNRHVQDLNAVTNLLGIVVLDMQVKLVRMRFAVKQFVPLIHFAVMSGGIALALI